MTDPAIRIIIQGLNPLVRKLKQPGMVKRVTKRGLRPLADTTVDGIKRRITDAPRVDLGTLRDGIYVDDQSSASWAWIKFVIRPSEQADRYAIFVEEDTRPHWPPIDAIQGWSD